MMDNRYVTKREWIENQVQGFRTRKSLIMVLKELTFLVLQVISLHASS